MRTIRTRKSGFTLVEILIVVIILGILAAIVIPQFTNASTEARNNSTTSLLQTIRSQMELYKLQHGDVYPAGLATNWDELTASSTFGGQTCGPYLQSAPRNPLNQSTEVQVATVANPATFTANGTAGFVFDSATGKFWATDAAMTALVQE